MPATLRPHLTSLEKLLHDKENRYRGRACLAVWRVSGEAHRVIPTIRELLYDDQDVAKVICEMGQEAMPLVPDILRSGLSPHDMTQLLLAINPPPPNDAVSWLITEIERTKGEERLHCIVSLGEMEQEHERIVPALLGYLAMEDSAVRATAVGYLYLMKGHEAQILPALVRGLDDPAAAVRKNCAWSLGELGAAAEPALPRLRQIAKLEGRDPLEERDTARTAIERIEAHLPVPSE